MQKPSKDTCYSVILPPTETREGERERDKAYQGDVNAWQQRVTQICLTYQSADIINLTQHNEVHNYANHNNVDQDSSLHMPLNGRNMCHLLYLDPMQC